MDTPNLDAAVAAADKAAAAAQERARGNGNNFVPVKISDLIILTPEQKTLAVLERIEVLLLNIVKDMAKVMNPPLTVTVGSVEDAYHKQKEKLVEKLVEKKGRKS